MKTYIYRNVTIDSFFIPIAKELGMDIIFSGYNDISKIDISVDLYIWCYFLPYKADRKSLFLEIEQFYIQLEFTVQRLPNNKTILVFTLTSFFDIKLELSNNEITNAILNYNSRVVKLAEKYSNVRIINLESFAKKYNSKNVIDWKYYFLSRMPINPKLAKDFERWFLLYYRAIQLNRKKCLVLDLDNTLWGGVLGEDGVYGIQIGGDYPGKAFSLFQSHILELKRQGVILAICSKNNMKDVEEGWRENKSIILQKNHFSAIRINWQDKVSNIVELSKELNIGFDSMVFVDDNPTERVLVKGMLPDVEVPEFPKHPYELITFIQDITEDYFQIYKLTSEDLSKTEQYQANAERLKLKVSFNTLEDYLSSLDILLRISEISDSSLNRVAQLTQKTNQFNLTTKRYTTSDLQNICSNNGYIWTLEVSDKFGDYGIVGVIIVVDEGVQATIDTLLLSCRVLGKNIEKEFVNYILNLLKNMGFHVVLGEYIPTIKNSQVATFYQSLNFESVKECKFVKSLTDFEYKPFLNYKIL